MSLQKPVTPELETILDVEIADSVTDQESIISLDVSAVKSFHMESDQDLVVEINDNFGGGGVINLAANIPYQWHVGSPKAFEFGTDWTSIFLSNASGFPATLKIRALLELKADL